MKLESTFSHRHGADVWKDRELYEWITDVFEAPDITIGRRATPMIREHVKRLLAMDGWAFDVRVDPESELTIFSKKDDLAVQLQTGNISRYAYDLLKIQHLYVRKEIQAAALAIPTKFAAQNLGDNIANAERVWNELTIFDRVITAPILLIAFE